MAEEGAPGSEAREEAGQNNPASDPAGTAGYGLEDWTGEGQAPTRGSPLSFLVGLKALKRSTPRRKLCAGRVGL